MLGDLAVDMHYIPYTHIVPIYLPLSHFRKTKISDIIMRLEEVELVLVCFENHLVRVSLLNVHQLVRI